VNFWSSALISPQKQHQLLPQTLIIILAMLTFMTLRRRFNYGVRITRFCFCEAHFWRKPLIRISVIDIEAVQENQVSSIHPLMSGPIPLSLSCSYCLLCSVIFPLLTIPLRLAILVLYLPSQRAPFLGFTNATLFLFIAYNLGSQ
jgi:hypothetical protein